ncbi:hypothetical protein M9Y10_044890 [Tritrichomonas musculus]|uniref:Uncharacterized protein n=1 Tax=Tritrichomonas musculus TaxID=1915356 RepID=A0ABR2JTW7_9EUKA
MEISEADHCALRMRFRQTLLNDKLVIHRLPNRLIILTFNPNYIRQCSEIEMCLNVNNQREVVAGECLCKTDRDTINIPVGGKIVDINTNTNNEIQLFQTGLTSSFLVIMQPVNFKISLPPSFQPLY